jgi:hypothetical protein
VKISGYRKKGLHFWKDHPILARERGRCEAPAHSTDHGGSSEEAGDRDTGSRPHGAGRTRVLFDGVCPLTHRFPTPEVGRLLTLLILLVGLMADPARSEEVGPPPPPVVDTPPPPPFPVTVYPEDDRPSAQSVAVGPVSQQPAGDPYGFTAWLNGVRARSGLGAVGYDPNLSGWAGVNNGQQQARGLGHHVMGPARRQNAGMGDFSAVTQMWMASPAHQAALLDPSINWVGIAGLGAWWTFNAY